jgi:hypothetical protein
MKKISIEIDYGIHRPGRTIEVNIPKDRTVLQLLQTIADVKTHPVENFVFVTAIDGIEGKRGEMAWYYEIDDQPAKELAFTNKLSNIEKKIKWIYKTDVCSRKVDQISSLSKTKH